MRILVLLGLAFIFSACSSVTANDSASKGEMNGLAHRVAVLEEKMKSLEGITAYVDGVTVSILDVIADTKEGLEGQITNIKIESGEMTVSTTQEKKLYDGNGDLIGINPNYEDVLFDGFDDTGVNVTIDNLRIKLDTVDNGFIKPSVPGHTVVHYSDSSCSQDPKVEIPLGNADFDYLLNGNTEDIYVEVDVGSTAENSETAAYYNNGSACVITDISDVLYMADVEIVSRDDYKFKLPLEFK